MNFLSNFLIKFTLLLKIKKAGKPRYKNILPKGAAEHMNKFKPNQFEKSGKEALFNLVTGIPFSPFISKTRKHPHGEKPEFKKPFTYNNFLVFMKFLSIFFLIFLIFYFNFPAIINWIKYRFFLPLYLPLLEI